MVQRGVTMEVVPAGVRRCALACTMLEHGCEQKIRKRKHARVAERAPGTRAARENRARSPAGYFPVKVMTTTHPGTARVVGDEQMRRTSSWRQTFARREGRMKERRLGTGGSGAVRAQRVLLFATIAASALLLFAFIS